MRVPCKRFPAANPERLTWIRAGTQIHAVDVSRFWCLTCIDDFVREFVFRARKGAAVQDEGLSIRFRLGMVDKDHRKDHHLVQYLEARLLYSTHH